MTTTTTKTTTIFSLSSRATEVTTGLVGILVYDGIIFSQYA
jgi:hypothetical protein